MRVENTTGHTIEINGKGKSFSIPPATKTADQKTVNGEGDVDDALVSHLRAEDAVFKAWLDSGDLVIPTGSRKTSITDDAKAAQEAEAARLKAESDAAAAKAAKK